MSVKPNAEVRDRRCLERDYTLGEFLEYLPTVTREMSCAILELPTRP
jgi:hypothetical protein